MLGKLQERTEPMEGEKLKASEGVEVGDERVPTSMLKYFNGL